MLKETTNPHNHIGPLLTAAFHHASAKRMLDSRQKGLDLVRNNKNAHPAMEERAISDLHDAQHRLQQTGNALRDAALAYGGLVLSELDDAYNVGFEEGKQDDVQHPPDWVYDRD